MKRYENYKNSGVQWLGEIPEHWEVVKLKFFSDIYNGDSLNESQKKNYSSNNSEHLPYISSKDIDINFSSINYNNGLRIPNGKNFKVAKKETILLCIEGGSAGKKIAFTNQEVTFVNKLACLKSNNSILSKFVFYSLKGIVFRAQFFNSLTGLIGGVSISNIKNFNLLIPPLSEQTAIANFLDDKTAKIDQAIAIKEKEIALLKERRQILIQKAVTKGLDPNVKMKNSGVDWIGEIPEHWEVRKLRNCLRAVSIKNRGDMTLLSITREKGVIIRDQDNQDENHNFIPDDLSGYKMIKKGQFGMNKMKAWQGSYGISKYDGIVSPAYYIFNLTDNFNSEYFHLAIRSSVYIPFFVQASEGVRIGQWDLNKNRMNEIPFFIPSNKEQLEIVSFIENMEEKITKAISLKQQEIEKLKEYKTVLIDHVVTGKVRV